MAAKKNKPKPDPAFVKKARAELGMTQKQLAEALGVHPLTVCYWETSRAAVTPMVRKFIGHILSEQPEQKAEGGER